MEADRVSAWFAEFNEDERRAVIAAVTAFPEWLANSIDEVDLAYADVLDYIRHIDD